MTFSCCITTLLLLCFLTPVAHGAVGECPVTAYSTAYEWRFTTVNGKTTKHAVSVQLSFLDRRCCPGFAKVHGVCQPSMSCNPPCQNGGTCVFSRFCFCPPGYQGFFTQCQHDIDECAANTDECSHDCINTVGSFRCECPPGYSTAADPNGKQCSNVDECAANTDGCSHDCINTVESFRCECPPGYSTAADPNGKQCSRNQTEDTKFFVHNNPSDPIIMEAITPDGETIFMVGKKNDSGFPVSVDSFEIVDSQGSSTKVNLGKNGVPVKVAGANGSSIDFIWSDDLESLHLSSISGDGTSQVNLNVDLNDLLNDILSDSHQRRNVRDIDIKSHFDSPSSRLFENENSQRGAIHSDMLHGNHMRQSRQTARNVAQINVNVTTCGQPEVNVDVGARVYIGYNQATKGYSVKKTFIGTLTNTQGIYQVKIPFEISTISAKDISCELKQVYGASGTCVWYNNQKSATGSPQKVSDAICNELAMHVPLTAQQGILTMCKNAFKGQQAHCQPTSSQSPTQDLCELVTETVDAAIGFSRGLDIFVEIYSVFGSTAGEVSAPGKTLQLQYGTIGNFSFENPNENPVVESLIVTPGDPEPFEDYIVDVIYSSCASGMSSITMHIIGTDTYEDDITCSGVFKCSLSVPGAEFLVEDTVTVTINDKNNFSLERVLLIIF